MKAVFHLQNIGESLLFVDAVKSSKCKVRVYYDQRIVDGCSLMGVLSLGLFQGASVDVRGEDKEVEGFMHKISSLVYKS